eukprot:TRINITY_DN5455_c0_g2_i2.p1 TRINITY_DN5455_c0_g2~~TRINITY_DN5455_c0_g2_i2.p1  ORF type:complete len:111 (+),score=2.74 TRINITY_DN5455_c0_g2_i2:83-415(+)
MEYLFLIKCRSDVESVLEAGNSSTIRVGSNEFSVVFILMYLVKEDAIQLTVMATPGTGRLRMDTWFPGAHGQGQPGTRLHVFPVLVFTGSPNKYVVAVQVPPVTVPLDVP